MNLPRILGGGTVARIAKSYTIHRFLTAGLMFGTALYAASALDAAVYGQVFLAMFVAKFLLIGNLGSVSGYIHAFYTDPSHELGDGKAYMVCYAVHLAALAAIAIAVGSFLGSAYVVGGLAFLLLVPFYLIEPVCRVKRRFYVSLAPDWLLNVSLLFALTYLSLTRLEGATLSEVAYPLLGFLLAACGLFLVHSSKKWGVGIKGVRFTNLHAYPKLLKRGMPLYAGTAAFTLLIFVDRFFLERFHDPQALGSYMLAFQLATGASLMLTAMNFVGSVDYGELIKANLPLRARLLKRLRRALVLSGVSLLMLLGFVTVISPHWAEDYYNLVTFTMSLGFGLCAFHTVGSITPVAFLLNRQRFLTALMLCFVLLAVFVNVLIVRMSLSSLWVAAAMASWLLIYSLLAGAYVLALKEKRLSASSLS